MVQVPAATILTVTLADTLQTDGVMLLTETGRPLDAAGSGEIGKDPLSA